MKAIPFLAIIIIAFSNCTKKNAIDFPSHNYISYSIDNERIVIEGKYNDISLNGVEYYEQSDFLDFFGSDKNYNRIDFDQVNIPFELNTPITLAEGSVNFRRIHPTTKEIERVYNDSSSFTITIKENTHEHISGTFGGKCFYSNSTASIYGSFYIYKQ